MPFPALVGVVGTTLVSELDAGAEGAARVAVSSAAAVAMAGAGTFLATAAGEAPGFRMVAEWFESIRTERRLARLKGGVKYRSVAVYVSVVIFELPANMTHQTYYSSFFFFFFFFFFFCE